ACAVSCLVRPHARTRRRCSGRLGPRARRRRRAVTRGKKRVIGSLRGQVLERVPTGEVLLEVGGVGYRIFVPLGSLETLVPGEPAFVFTHQHVRDDAITLYG